MKHCVGLCLFFVCSFFFVSCEKSIEDKKIKIEANQIQNRALFKEIKADSLKRRAERLDSQSKSLEKEADRLRDSANKL